MPKRPFSQAPVGDEKSLKMRPGRPQRGEDSSDRVRFTPAVPRLLQLARHPSRGSSGGAGRGASRGRGPSGSKNTFTKAYQQRGTATVRFMKPGKSGKAGGWKRHGSYLERDGTAGKDGPLPGDRVGLAKGQNLSKLADGWEKAGDPRMWK